MQAGAARPGQIDEERRLLYVGMTRAKRHLALTWSGKPSRFLLELGVEAAQRRGRPAGPRSLTTRPMSRSRSGV